MNNTEVRRAIAQNTLFYWMHLANGEQYLVPFLCQRCGTCCQAAYEVPCRYFEEPNICGIYEERPSGCRRYPVYVSFGAGGVDCQGDSLAQRAKASLGEGVGYHIGFRGGYIFRATRELDKAVANLGKAKLPQDFITKFIELNS